MFVKDVMQHKVVTISPSSNLSQAARKMVDNNIGCLLVTDEKQQLKGLLTDRDIAICVAVEKRDPELTFCEDIMSSRPVCTERDSDLETALRTMMEAQVHRLPVMGGDRLVGVLSASDIAGILKGQMSQFFDLEQIYAHH